MPINAETFKALGDRTRLSLFELLLERPHRVKELVARLAVPQPLVSRHLRILKDAGLVEDERQGRGVTYQVASSDGASPSLLRDWAERAALRFRGPNVGLSTASGSTADHDDDLAFVVKQTKDAFDSYLL